MPAPAAAILKSCLPTNGMAWPACHPHITRRRHVDARVVAGLRSLGVAIRRRDVQIALTALVDDATALAGLVVSDSGHDVERADFVFELHCRTKLGGVLSFRDFEQVFTSIVLARHRYLDDRLDDDLPAEDPATHSELARAVDRFEAAAWFWSSVEAFLEDDCTRADEAEEQGDDNDLPEFESSSVGDNSHELGLAGGEEKKEKEEEGWEVWEEDEGEGAPAIFAPVSAEEFGAIAAGVDAMVLDDDMGLGQEMDLDDF